MKAYLGIDIGSVSTNLAVLDEGKNLLVRRYLPTAGRPIEAVRRGLAEIAGELGGAAEIAGVGTTGSGRYLIGDLVGADIVKNEITAQAAGALHFDPAVDTIFEIGGQDSKYISLADGVIVDFAMNKVCAAGTGSFLEEQAAKLGIDLINDFARLALAAQRPSPLGDRCTVFIESELNHLLQKGAPREELAAGLAVAIVKNYLHKVVETRRVGRLIFFQGGVAANRAVVAAFSQVIGRPVTVPPHHDITGAIGIALIAAREKNWERSRFKGFGLAGQDYTLRTFACHSCTNLCEINEVSCEHEPPLFYGGRCEQWEKKASTAGGQLPDLFQKRDEIVFGQPLDTSTRPAASLSARGKAEAKVRIGIPRVLFFYERFPFWQAFFLALGLEVVLSDPSNAKMAEASLDHVAAEACFPITLAHGHVQDLLDKKVDILFLPSLVNMEKSSARFRESFNCPFIQALPYFIKSGFNFDRRIKVLSPALEPQRGESYFTKQLLQLGRSLGKKTTEIRGAIARAAAAQQACRQQLRTAGEEVLTLVSRTKLPAVVIISRPYNGSDNILNLAIPKKLKEMGVLAIPLDFLPIDNADVAEEHPNMYWNYGQRVLAAAKFVARHPDLCAIQISNFRCGPDSFISPLLKASAPDKPLLQIEVDEHSSDTGVITRLEAFLESRKNVAAQDRASRSRQPVPAAPAAASRRRTVFIPRMCDHAEVLAAAMRAYDIPAAVLPRSDARTIELGRQYTSGKECHPFIVTTGDFLKKIGESGFDQSSAAFFMPMASGPCRFGQYHQAQQAIFKQIGYDDIPILSPDVRDAYGRSMGLDLGFRRLTWNGVVAVDLLNELAAAARPYEKEPGAVNRLKAHWLERLAQSVEQNGGGVRRQVREMKSAFAALPLTGVNHKPFIGIVGEIFLRYNPQCNADIVRKIEQLGGRTYTAPISEWFYYTNLGFIYESWMQKKPRQLALALLADVVQRWDESRLGHSQPPALKLIRLASPYLHFSFKGEAVLTLGQAIELIGQGAAGIVNIMPFTCMPGTVVSAAMHRLRQDHGGIPWLDLAIDGNEGVNLETRLEAFMHQAADYNATSPRAQK
jgi:predicted CoA-substrate-specific enzyme activase